MRVDRELGLLEQAGAVGETEDAGEVRQRARALLAADHREVRLVAVQPGEQDDAGLVEARRRLEDVARQRHRRRQDRVEAVAVAGGECRERCARRRRDRVEDAEQGVALALVRRRADAVAGDQLGVVEVVAGVHANAFGQAPPHRDLLVLVEQRDLDAVDLARIGGDDAERGRHRRVDVAAAPVAGQRRIEHVAEPVQDHRLLRLRQDPVVDALVVGQRWSRRERAPGSP